MTERTEALRSGWHWAAGSPEWSRASPRRTVQTGFYL